MTRSVIFAGLLAVTLAACSQPQQAQNNMAAAPAPVAAAAPAAAAAPSGFLPYCGPVWSVPRQGYVNLPCP